MLAALNKKSLLLASSFLMSLMFVIVMFYVNPFIDGGNGSGVIKLQLSFDKAAGIEIINSWGASGTERFLQWIFTDYIYAFAYTLFFASLLASLVVRKGKEESFIYRNSIYLAFAAGFFDWMENTIELFFISNPLGFSSMLFFLHSVLASLKWAAVPMALSYIVLLLLQKNKLPVPQPIH